MTNDPEADRLRTAYARRDRLGLDARYDYWRPDNLFIYQARERAVLELLGAAGFLPLAGKRVLDAGCGDGAVLQDLLRYGASAIHPAHPGSPQGPGDSPDSVRPEPVEVSAESPDPVRPEPAEGRIPAGALEVHGVDLLPDRVESACVRLPSARIQAADARALPYEDAYFDLTLGFTLLSSVVDPSARRQVAAEMARVTQPGGLVLLYDFWINPTNRTVRPLRRSEVRALFPGRPVDFRSTTLAPPLTRLLFRLPCGRIAATLLDVLPFLRTHFVAAVHV